MQMKRRRHDETDKEGWTSGGDLADVEETPRSRSDAHNVLFPPPFSSLPWGIISFGTSIYDRRPE